MTELRSDFSMTLTLVPFRGGTGKSRHTEICCGHETSQSVHELVDSGSCQLVGSGIHFMTLSHNLVRPCVYVAYDICFVFKRNCVWTWVAIPSSAGGTQPPSSRDLAVLKQSSPGRVQ